MGLQLRCSRRVQVLLEEEGAEEQESQVVVPYTVLRDKWRRMEAAQRPRFVELLRGAELVIESPKPREKSEELKERLDRLRKRAEVKAYEELVKDVAHRGHGADAPFSTYKDQLGFGVHVIVTMFTGFLLGFALFRSQFHDNPVLHAVGGLVGLFIAMILETLLFIVRDYQYTKIAEIRSKAGRAETKKTK